MGPVMGGPKRPGRGGPEGPGRGGPEGPGRGGPEGPGRGGPEGPGRGGPKGPGRGGLERPGRGGPDGISPPRSRGPRRLATPRAVEVSITDGGRPESVGGRAVEAVRESWLVEDRWWSE